MEQQPAPGWRRDPFGRRTLRWWDGERWTAYAGDSVTAVEWDPAPVDDAGDGERSAAHAGLRGVGVALVGYVAGVVAALALRAALDADDGAGALALSSLALWTGLVAAAAYISVRRGTGSLVRDYAVRIRWADVGFGFAASLVARVVAGAAVTPLPLPLPTRSISEDERSIVESATNGTLTWIVVIVVVCVGAPIVEELFFRGVVQSRLVTRFGVVPGLAVASLLFGAAHLVAWDGPLTLVYAWAVASGGLVLGLTYHLTQRLGPAIVAHAFFNAQAVVATALLT